MFLFILVLLAAVFALGAYVRFRRGSGAGDRSAETHKAGWLHKSEGI